MVQPPISKHLRDRSGIPTHSERLQEAFRDSSHIRGLDALRGVSACLVVFAHTIFPRQLGALAVAVFFVISGFLITFLLLRENDATGGVSLRNFYIRRTLRIFPAFYVFWFVCVGAAVLRGGHLPVAELAAAVFYMGDYYAALSHSWFAAAPAGIMGITWSLGIEEKFYLLWPYVFRRHKDQLATLLRIAIGFILVIWLYRVLVWCLFRVPRDYLRYSFESRFDNILFGCAAAIALKSGKLERVFRWADRWRPMPLGLGVTLIALALAEEKLGPGYHYIFGMQIDAVIITVMLLQFVFLSTLRGWGWLEHPVFRFLGSISYSLYLYHIVVIATVHHFLPALRLRGALPLIFGTSILLAFWSRQYIEKPFLKMKERFTSQDRIPTNALETVA